MIRERLGRARSALRARGGAQRGAPDTSDASAMFAWCRAGGVDTRPQYLWGVLQAARIGAALGYPSVSVIELGVAGGNGLLALERAAAAAEEVLPVSLRVFGFDSGRGLPAPKDHRDVPWLLQAGWFPMDAELLRSRLRRAELVLGEVHETVPRWLETDHPPLGFCAFDLDYYSSTLAAFALLEGDPAGLLPRVPAYFDDVLGYGWSDFNGERAAIADFNAAHAERKIAPIHGLRFELPTELHAAWPEKMHVVHFFDHPRYSEPEGRIADHWFDSLKLR